MHAHKNDTQVHYLLGCKQFSFICVGVFRFPLFIWIKKLPNGNNNFWSWSAECDWILTFESKHFVRDEYRWSCWDCLKICQAKFNHFSFVGMFQKLSQFKLRRITRPRLAIRKIFDHYSGANSSRVKSDRGILSYKSIAQAWTVIQFLSISYWSNSDYLGVLEVKREAYRIPDTK